MDKIKIKDLEVFAHHGVFKEENVLGQKFVVSVTFFLDTSLAGKNDDLEKSINYAEASWKIRIKSGKSFHPSIPHPTL